MPGDLVTVCLAGGLAAAIGWRLVGWRVAPIRGSIGAMIGACEYPNCHEVATQLIVIELDPGPTQRRVCSRHAERAQEMARQEGGLAYRVYRT